MLTDLFSAEQELAAGHIALADWAEVAVVAPATANLISRLRMGRANDAVIRLLADTVEVPRRRVSLVSGHTARDKVVELHGVEAAEVERRLAGRSA